MPIYTVKTRPIYFREGRRIILGCYLAWSLLVNVVLIFLAFRPIPFSVFGVSCPLHPDRFCNLRSVLSSTHLILFFSSQYMEKNPSLPLTFVMEKSHLRSLKIQLTNVTLPHFPLHSWQKKCWCNWRHLVPVPWPARCFRPWQSGSSGPTQLDSQLAWKRREDRIKCG